MNFVFARLFLIFIILVDKLSRTTAKTVTYSFSVSRKVLAPDLIYKKSVIVVNGQFPGPTIKCDVGDTLVVTVTNHLTEEETFSMHWHGINQIGSPFSDGAPGASNCPIPYSSSYVYKFVVDEAGTFFYHPHNRGARSDGGYGMLIVNEKTPISTYDFESHILLSDYYHQAGHYIETGLLNIGPKQGTGTSFTGFLFPGTGDAILVNGLQALNITVIQNKIYRFRIVNAASLGYYNFAIAGHNLTVVSSGATPTKPVKLQSLDIAAGQRFDILIDTSLPSAAYRISIKSQWRGNDITPSGVFNSAFVKYSQSTIISSIQPRNEIKPWNEQISLIEPRTNHVLPSPTITLRFNMSQAYVNASSLKAIDFKNAYSDGYLRWTVKNDMALVFPSTPLLLASYYGMLNTIGYSDHSKPIRIELNSVVEIVIQNRAALNGVCEAHPWHLHGSSFWVVGYGPGEYKDDSLASNSAKNPMITDTTVNYPTAYTNPRAPLNSFTAANANKPCGWTVIRFVANNPGIWPMHCHIDWHLSLGMGVIFDVASERVANQEVKPQTCGVITDSTPLPLARQALSSSSSNKDQMKQQFSTGELSALVICVFAGGLLVGIITIFLFKSARNVEGNPAVDSKKKEPIPADFHDISVAEKGIVKVDTNEI